MDNRRVVEELAQAIRDRDLETVARLTHPDIVVRYPQSGEEINGADNYLAMLRSFPMGVPEAEVEDPAGSQQTVQVTPQPFGLPSISVVGSGDTFVIEGLAHYPAEGDFHIVSIVRVNDGAVIEETSYFAAPFPPPEWRAPYVEG